LPQLVEGLCAPLPMTNVDTDIIMPKRFLLTITREGLGEGAFADLRFDDNGALRSEFVLNQYRYKEASILIVGDNFGCGSSREHAVWGLTQLGIGAIIGTGFAGIFYDNARKNGLALPIVSPDDRDDMLRLADEGDGLSITIDIANRTISSPHERWSFDMDDGTRKALLEDRDDTLDTLNLSDRILAFEEQMPENKLVRVNT
jgi:3-isopropylmalate/(R)-2-methylmalate dehydratase small subunit